MSGAPPTAVLSERLQAQIASRTVRAGVFLTYRFDPGFFEQEVLPTLFDRAFSHEPAVRLIQLEEVIRDCVESLAVYYDHGALEAGATSAKLDVRRIPIVWRTGYFHPKIVLLLLESVPELDKPEAEPQQNLLLGVMSANLTRAGWWENVEAAHFEELALDSKSSLRDDLRALLKRVHSAAPPTADHSALERILKFLAQLESRKQWTASGVLHPRLWCGESADRTSAASLPDFLRNLLPGDERTRRLNLEVVSPYLDESEATGPLKELVDRFAFQEIRVFLPLGPDGTPLVSRQVFDAIGSIPGVSWSHLPKDLLQSGEAEQAALRRVHAKVYRFFSLRPRYEAIFVGSVNLTNPGHSKGGNLEAGILIEAEPDRALDWWLGVERNRPTEFPEAGDNEDARTGPGAALALRYSWDRGAAEARWAGTETSPRLRLDTQGSPLFDLGPLRPGVTVTLSRDQAEALRVALSSTSFVTVRVEGEDDATILVEEEGMAAKPSILLNLSVADILRYWSELNEAQKTALIEEHYAQLVPALSALMPSAPLGALEAKSLFESFAGIFHAFGSLERDVRSALEKGREKEAVYRVLGRKHDSLPHLVDRVLTEEKALDAVERYVILLCARQLLDRLREEHPAFTSAHSKEIAELRSKLERVSEARVALAPALGEDADAFLDWYERWFLRRAEPLKEEAP